MKALLILSLAVLLSSPLYPVKNGVYKVEYSTGNVGKISFDGKDFKEWSLNDNMIARYEITFKDSTRAQLKTIGAYVPGKNYLLGQTLNASVYQDKKRGLRRMVINFNKGKPVTLKVLMKMH